jgi:hypothetical protein
VVVWLVEHLVQPDFHLNPGSRGDAVIESQEVEGSLFVIIPGENSQVVRAVVAKGITADYRKRQIV